MLKLTFCGKKCLETEIFNKHVDFNRGREGTKMFGSGRNDYNCKSERSASSIRGVVSVLDAFPISFLKKYYHSFEFVQQIMSQKKHIFISRSMSVFMIYPRKCAKYLSWNMFEYLKRNYFKFSNFCLNVSKQICFDIWNI